MKNTLLTLALLFSALLFLGSCGDDDPVEPENEEEVITTVNLTFTPTSGTAVTMTYKDEDGEDGPAAPTVTGGTLAANSTYTLAVELLNETENPAEDVTEEIEEEDLDHQFFFTVSSALNMTVAYADQDSQGNPIGLSNTITTGDASTGTLTVVLRHEPDKSATGVSGGDATNAGGETDIETNPAFPITIQ